jgi:LPS export ABC transporter protein LptC
MINKGAYFKKNILQAALFSSCLFFFSCENDQKTIDEWTGKRELVEEAKNVESFLSQNGILKAKLVAPIMIRFQGDTIYTEFPKKLHVDFYDSLAKRESWLDARYGKYFENLNKVLLRDSVVVINIKGDTLQTSELWWDQNSKKFYTEKEVRIAQKTKHIYGGKGLVADKDLSNVEIKYPTGNVLMNNSVLPTQ